MAAAYLEQSMALLTYLTGTLSRLAFTKYANRSVKVATRVRNLTCKNWLNVRMDPSSVDGHCLFIRLTKANKMNEFRLRWKAGSGQQAARREILRRHLAAPKWRRAKTMWKKWVIRARTETKINGCSHPTCRWSRRWPPSCRQVMLKNKVQPAEKQPKSLCHHYGR